MYDIKLIKVCTMYLPAIGAPAVLAIPETANTIPRPVGYVSSPTNSKVVIDITVTTPPRAIPYNAITTAFNEYEVMKGSKLRLIQPRKAYIAGMASFGIFGLCANNPGMNLKIVLTTFIPEYNQTTEVRSNPFCSKKSTKNTKNPLNDASASDKAKQNPRNTMFCSKALSLFKVVLESSVSLLSVIFC